MKHRHYYFFSIKIIILFCVLLLALKKITSTNIFYVLFEFIFRFSIGLFIIIYFVTHKKLNISHHDRLLFIISGFVILILIDYIKVINILFNKKIVDKNCL